MLIYRFRVSSEQYDDFIREIVIQPNQTFLDFHFCLLESVELMTCEQASFFITDKTYQKQLELSLKPKENRIRRYDRELDEMVTEVIRPSLMKDSKVKHFIEDPHQRMLYEFQANQRFLFQIELIKVMQSDLDGFLPRCLKSQGELPKKVEIPLPPATQEVLPVIPKSIPKPVVSPFESMITMDEITEDEEELSEIEAGIDELLADELVPGFTKPSRIKTPRSVNKDPDEEPEDGEGEMLAQTGFPDEDAEGILEHIDDYENIESLEMRFPDFDDDSENE